MSRRPNLLFVFADQMRGMDMGCAGHPQVRTPALDRLAAEGVLLPRAYANCPVCTPSRATILTGRYAHSHGAIANDLPLAPGETTIAHVLRDAGYRTGYVGKWHLDGVPRSRFTPPGARRFGFDWWAAWNCDHGYFRGRVYRDAPEPVRLEGYEPVGQTDLVLEFLDARDDRPFCMFLSWGPPHNPYRQAPDRFLSMYDPAGLELRPNVPVDRVDEQQLRAELSGYYAHITALDEQLGRLLDALEARRLADDTIVVFTSDHGDMLGSQGRIRKEQPWEESIRIPLLVRWPGRVPAGRTCGALASTVDLAPTLLGLADLAPPEAMAGANLAPIWLGEDRPGPEAVLLQEVITVDEGLWQNLTEWRGLVTDRYTYARWLDGRPWVLYDNEADPFQMQDVAGSPAHEDLRRRLDGDLDRLLRAAGDPLLPWPEMIRREGLVDLWNARERALHPKDPRLLE